MAPRRRHSGESLLTLLTVIPAKAGIHFDFAFRRCARPTVRPCRASPAIPGGRVTFFACPKKVTKERHPRGRGRRASLPVDSASRLRGSSAVRPCTVDELARILRAIASRLFLHLLAATWRGPGGKQSAAVPAAEALALDPGSLCEAAEVGRTRPRAPHAGRARTARLWRQGRKPCRQTPADRSEPARSAGA